MGLTVTDIENTTTVGEHSVRPGERTAQRIRLRAVPLRAGAEDRGDNAAFQVDRADHVRFGVGDVQHAIRVSKALRPCEFRRAGVAAVAGIALFTRASDVMDRSAIGVDVMDRVTLPQGEVEIAFVVEYHRSRAVQWSAAQWCSVRYRLPFAGAADCVDGVRRQVDITQSMVADVADEEAVAAGIDRDAVRLPQLRSIRWSAVAGETSAAGTRKGCDHAGSCGYRP